MRNGSSAVYLRSFIGGYQPAAAAPSVVADGSSGAGIAHLTGETNATWQRGVTFKPHPKMGIRDGQWIDRSCKNLSAFRSRPVPNSWRVTCSGSRTYRKQPPHPTGRRFGAS